MGGDSESLQRQQGWGGNFANGSVQGGKVKGRAASDQSSGSEIQSAWAESSTHRHVQETSDCARADAPAASICTALWAATASVRSHGSQLIPERPKEEDLAFECLYLSDRDHPETCFPLASFLDHRSDSVALTLLVP